MDDPQNPLPLLNTSVRKDPRRENQEEQVIGAAVEIRCCVPHLLSPLQGSARPIYSLGGGAAFSTSRVQVSRTPLLSNFITRAPWTEKPTQVTVHLSEVQGAAV